MSKIPIVPDELEFFEREFGLSEEHDPDEGVFSFIKQFEGNRNLIFTYEPPGYTVSTKIELNNELIAHVYKEGVTSVEFQSWGGEQTIRVYSDDFLEYRVHYNPIARIYYGAE